jgi:3-isopropylmalate dehydratase small subunit
MKPGDLIVAGRNFGCGSSREHAPLALKGAGHPGVIAASFARIFYRNAINIGFAVFESPEAAAEIRTGDEVTVDVERGEIRVARLPDKSFRFEPYPPELQAIIAAGGLMPYVKAKRAGK